MVDKGRVLVGRKAASLHETCQQYVARRLSEGWKIVSQKGFQVILQSPEGIIRPVDIRDDIETLRPNGAGTYTQIDSQFPASGSHYDKVNKETPDISIYVFTDIATETQIDTYALPNHSEGTGPINHVREYIRLSHITAFSPCNSRGKATIYTHSVLYYGNEEAGGEYSTFITYSKTWTTNPNTGAPWTWGEVDALQAGVTHYHDIFHNNEILCNQVYVEVDYTPPPAETAYNTMVGSPPSWLWEKCDYGAAEQCPAGSVTSWNWKAPISGGPDKTPQGSPTSFIWGSE